MEWKIFFCYSLFPSGEVESMGGNKYIYLKSAGVVCSIYWQRHRMRVNNCKLCIWGAFHSIKKSRKYIKLLSWHWQWCLTCLKWIIFIKFNKLLGEQKIIIFIAKYLQSLHFDRKILMTQILLPGHKKVINLKKSTGCDKTWH